MTWRQLCWLESTLHAALSDSTFHTELLPASSSIDLRRWLVNLASFSFLKLVKSVYL